MTFKNPKATFPILNLLPILSATIVTTTYGIRITIIEQKNVTALLIITAPLLFPLEIEPWIILFSKSPLIKIPAITPPKMLITLISENIKPIPFIPSKLPFAIE
ncbi:hypothetical protein D3C76_799210 [compost metagenome]